MPRKGIGYWPYWKLYAFMWCMVNGAVVLNTLVIWSAARVYDHYIFSFWDAWLILFPLTLLGAYWLTNWVRHLVSEAEKGR